MLHKIANQITDVIEKDYGTRMVIANWDAHFYLTKDPFMITDTKPVKLVKKQLQESQQSIYSRKIGSLINTDFESREYCCDCNNLRGKFYQGQTCPICGTQVKDQFYYDLTKFGWIDLQNFYVINPVCYTLIMKVIGKTALERILKHQLKVDINGIPIKDSSKKSNLYDGIGMIEFRKKFEAILLHYATKSKKIEKIKIAKLLIKKKHRVFVSKIPVMNSLLRPGFKSSKKPSLKTDAINKPYMSILKNADIVRRNYNRISRISILNNLYNIQVSLNSLFNTIVSMKLSGKKKLIRSKILGSKVNFSSRMVLVSLLEDEHFNINHCVVSYKMFLEVFTYEIVNLLMNDFGGTMFEGMTPFEILNYIRLAKYSNKRDDKLYELMLKLVREHKDGIWLIINRNPTLDIGSTQMMKIVHVIDDPKVLVLKIPLPNMKPMNADCDGDILNACNPKEKCVSEEFQNTFAPVNLLLNRTGNGFLNNDFNIAKDTSTGLWAFTTPYNKYKLNGV